MSLGTEAGYGVIANGVELISEFNNPNFGTNVTDVFWAESDGEGEVDTTTTVEELFNSTNISIYPNPVSDKATLEVTTNSATSINLNIVNVLGKTMQSSVHNLNSGNNNITIDVNNLVNGIYFVQLTSEGRSSTQKITVTK